MADLIIPPSAQSLTPAAQLARSEATRAAQRAFFNQALAGVQAADPLRAVSHSAPQPNTPVKSSMDGTFSEPSSRMLRPGSLLDIKV